MSKKTNTQWHPAFYSAMKLELKEDAEHLEYEDEHILNSMPLKIDLLIIKKTKSIEIKNEIGKLFRITKEGFFPTQVIVSRKLSPENQKWLTVLCDNLTQADIERTIKQLNQLQNNAEKIYGDSVWQVAMVENKTLINQLKGDSKMCQAMREFFADELKEATELGMERATITNARNLFLNGVSYELVRASIKSLSDEVLQQIYQEVKNNSTEAES